MGLRPSGPDWPRRSGLAWLCPHLGGLQPIRDGGWGREALWDFTTVGLEG